MSQRRYRLEAYGSTACCPPVSRLRRCVMCSMLGVGHRVHVVGQSPHAAVFFAPDGCARLLSTRDRCQAVAWRRMATHGELNEFREAGLPGTGSVYIWRP